MCMYIYIERERERESEREKEREMGGGEIKSNLPRIMVKKKFKTFDLHTYVCAVEEKKGCTREILKDICCSVDAGMC